MLEEACKMHTWFELVSGEDLPLGKPADLIVTALDSFNEVVDKCFGMELKKDYELAIEQFMIDYRNCIHDNVILKAHILEVHTTTFFERQKELGYEGKGLAYWAEQASEHGDHDWNVTWQRSNYARALGHADFDSQLKKAGDKYNSWHL